VRYNYLVNFSKAMKENDLKNNSVMWDLVSVRALVLNHGNLLMAKIGAGDRIFANEQGKWALPGGLMDRNDDLEAAVLREVMAQSGWTIEHIRLYCINIYTGLEEPDPQELELIFIADAVAQTRQPENMVTELRWFPLTSLPEKQELAADHVEAVFALAKMLHGGKTLNLDQLPPVFTRKRMRSHGSLLLPDSYTGL